MGTEPLSVVVDASVVLKWVLPEPDSHVAAMLLEGGFRLYAPDLLPVEAANVIWRQAYRGLTTPESARECLKSVLACPIALHASRELLVSAHNIALQTRCTVYDSLYLALAQRRRMPLVTADERFMGGLAGTAYEASVRHLSSVFPEPDTG